MKQEASPTCFVLTLLAGLVFVVYHLYKAVQFSLWPDVFRTSLEFLAQVGLCLGGLLLAIVVLLPFIFIQSIFLERFRYKVRQLGKEYFVRCHPVELEEPEPGPIAMVQSNEAYQGKIEPIYLKFSMTNIGIRLSAIPEEDIREWIAADNASRFTLLSSNLPSPIIIPGGYFRLGHLLIRQNINQKFESTLTYEVGEARTLPPLVEGEQVMIVIIYSALVDTRNKNQIITRKQPLKLMLTAFGWKRSRGSGCHLWAVPCCGSIYTLSRDYRG